MGTECVQKHLRHIATVADFDECREWMQSENVQTAFSDWLATQGVERERGKTLLAFVFMNKDCDCIFTACRADNIMKREVAGVVDAMNNLLANADDASSHGRFVIAFSRACRFYRAWIAADRKSMMDDLMHLTLAAKAEGAPAPPADLIEMVRQVGGESGSRRVTEAFNLYTPIARDELARTVTDTARRAFWDVIQNDINNLDYESMYNVLTEMRQAMATLIAHSEQSLAELDDTFDVAWIRQRIEMGAMEISDMHGLMVYIARTIADWQAPADVADSDIWVERAINIPRDYGSMAEFARVHLVDFLKTAHLRLGTIYTRVLQLSSDRPD